MGHMGLTGQKAMVPILWSMGRVQGIVYAIYALVPFLPTICVIRKELCRISISLPISRLAIFTSSHSFSNQSLVAIAGTSSPWLFILFNTDHIHTASTFWVRLLEFRHNS
jgi:hypothetical protein